MIELTESNFDSEVLKSTVPVVIDFWAPWCGPCRMFSPTIEEVAKDLGSKAKFAKINTDEAPNIATKYNIMSIPTVLLFDKGIVKSTSVGALPKETFRKWLEKNL